jgi:hypothetical protein
VELVSLRQQVFFLKFQFRPCIVHRRLAGGEKPTPQATASYLRLAPRDGAVEMPERLDNFDLASFTEAGDLCLQEFDTTLKPCPDRVILDTLLRRRLAGGEKPTPQATASYLRLAPRDGAVEMPVKNSTRL